MLKQIWKNFVNFSIRANRLAYSPRAHKKFLEWAKANGYSIEKLEVSSIWEAGCFILVPESGTCVKALLRNSSGNLKAAYLLTGVGFSSEEMQVEFVSPEEICFTDSAFTPES